MMQASQSRDRNDSAIGRSIHFSLASGRSFFAQAEVGAVLVIVGDVSFHESLQMALVHHKHMAEQIPAAIADEALRDSVLPRTLKARSLGLNTKALDRITHIVIEARAAIEDQIARRGVVRKRFPQLLDDPRTRRLPGHVEVKNTPAFMRDHEEAVKHAECDGRHGEEVHCGDRFTMVAQEGFPTSRWLSIPGRLSHPAQDRSLGDFVSKHLQLAVDTRRTPGVVLHYHAKDEFAQRLRCRFLPARAWEREIPFQYNLNPTRCQRTTVSGCTMTRTRLQSDQNRRRMTQNRRSWTASRGRGCLAANAQAADAVQGSPIPARGEIEHSESGLEIWPPAFPA